VQVVERQRACEALTLVLSQDLAFFPISDFLSSLFIFRFCWIELSDKLYFFHQPYLTAPSRTLRGKSSSDTYRPPHSFYLEQPMDNGLLLTRVHSAQRRLFSRTSHANIYNIFVNLNRIPVHGAASSVHRLHNEAAHGLNDTVFNFYFTFFGR
jgi:hypothetical protein